MEDISFRGELFLGKNVNVFREMSGLKYSIVLLGTLLYNVLFCYKM